ncbi:MAG: TIGR02453 family protein [Alphaproteobacteria bacterium]|nr:TIGR02453 family protein [Alphaproteobacteria bacterium]
MAFDGFSKDFFKFLRELKKNNERAWFEANRERYRSAVQAPLSAFIADLAPLLARTSPHFKCDPRPNGGSMFRIHRDVRFARDKSPYKTHAAAHFRHSVGKDVHAPGFYLHLEPGRIFFGGGMYMPEPAALQMVRTRIAEKSADWRKAKEAASVSRAYGALSDGEALTRPPRGFDADHPMIEDLKRKSFFLTAESDEAAAGDPAFVKTVAKAYADAAPLMTFLCAAVGVKY